MKPILSLFTWPKIFKWIMPNELSSRTTIHCYYVWSIPWPWIYNSRFAKRNVYRTLSRNLCSFDRFVPQSTAAEVGEPESEGAAGCGRLQCRQCGLWGHQRQQCPKSTVCWQRRLFPQATRLWWAGRRLGVPFQLIQDALHTASGGLVWRLQ